MQIKCIFHGAKSSFQFESVQSKITGSMFITSLTLRKQNKRLISPLDIHSPTNQYNLHMTITSRSRSRRGKGKQFNVSTNFFSLFSYGDTPSLNRALQLTNMSSNMFWTSQMCVFYCTWTSGVFIDSANCFQQPNTPIGFANQRQCRRNTQHSTGALQHFLVRIGVSPTIANCSRVLTGFMITVSGLTAIPGTFIVVVTKTHDLFQRPYSRITGGSSDVLYWPTQSQSHTRLSRFSGR